MRGAYLVRLARRVPLNRDASVFVGAGLCFFSRLACFLAGPLSRLFGLALRLSLGCGKSFFFGSLSSLLRLALRRPCRFASLSVCLTLGVFGLPSLRLFDLALRLPLCRNVRLLFGATRFLLELPLPLGVRCRTRFFFGATLRFLGRTSLRLLFGLALPLRRGAGCQLGVVLGFFCLAVLPLSLGYSTGLALGASAAHAHDDPNDPSCESETNPADDEKQFHGWGSISLFCPPTVGHPPSRSRRACPPRSRRASADACRQ